MAGTKAAGEGGKSEAEGEEVVLTDEDGVFEGVGTGNVDL